MKINTEEVRRILVIKLRAVGDVLLSTIVLGNLRRAFPNARIDFLTEKPSREVLRGNTSIDSVIIFDRKETSGIGLIREIRREKYDLILDLFSNPRSAFVAYCSGARYRVGFPFRGRAYAYNIPVPPRGGEVHNTQFNLDALGAIGIPAESRTIEFPIGEDDHSFAGRFFSENGLDGSFVVGLAIGGGWEAKRWGIGRFAELADLFAARHRAKILALWGPGQSADVEKLRTSMKSPCTVPPMTSLKQLGALISRCSLVISNDSGPMHISAALHTPTLGIFGPTRPELQGPYGDEHGYVRKEGLECLGCNLTRCPIGNPCMVDLTVSEVAAAAERVMAKNNLLHSD